MQIRAFCGNFCKNFSHDGNFHISICEKYACFFWLVCCCFGVVLVVVGRHIFCHAIRQYSITFVEGKEALNLIWCLLQFNLREIFYLEILMRYFSHWIIFPFKSNIVNEWTCPGTIIYSWRHFKWVYTPMKFQ